MGVRILRSEMITEERPRLWFDGGSIFKDGACIASSDSDTYARAARFALEGKPLYGKTVAWIGGGLCIGPLLFSLLGCGQTIYELEPELLEFCPPGALFMAGDWKDMITGHFDVIVYDLGGEVPSVLLSRFLNEGGKILS